MGFFRFRQSIGSKLFRLNFSKSGISLSTGVPGFTVNTNLAGNHDRGQRLTLGVPGTGLSYVEQGQRHHQPSNRPTPQQQANERAFFVGAAIGAGFSKALFGGRRRRRNGW